MKFRLFIAFLFVFSLPLAALAQSFPDVPKTHPNYAAIESLKKINVIGGYPDGTFKPANPVQRVEALKMILGSAQIKSDGASDVSGLSDVPKDVWFTAYVAKAKELSIVQGNPDGTFKPDRQVNKAEFVKMVLMAFKQDISKHENLSSAPAKDVPVNQWFAPHMSYARAIGIVVPDGADNLTPSKSLTRAECAEILYKMLILNRGGDIQKYLSLTESNLVDVLVKLNNGELDKAIQAANSAVDFSQKALALDGEKGIIKAANKIALGFQSLTKGYQAGVSGDFTSLQKFANEAKDLAGAAYDHDPATQPLGKKIKEQADILLKQIPN
jgi:hypothetical protein